LQIELVLTAATFAVAIIGSIAGIFGMNLNNGHEDSHALFLVVSTTFCAMLMLFVPWSWHTTSVRTLYIACAAFIDSNITSES